MFDTLIIEVTCLKMISSQYLAYKYLLNSLKHIKLFKHFFVLHILNNIFEILKDSFECSANNFVYIYPLHNL